MIIIQLACARDSLSSVVRYTKLTDVSNEQAMTRLCGRYHSTPHYTVCEDQRQKHGENGNLR